jgi:hypothetical protein
MNQSTEIKTGRGQEGGGILTVVAVLGLLLMMVQGSIYYRAQGSAKLLRSEKNKVAASQLAEAGIEENIADFGKRTIRITSGVIDSVTYANKSFEGGTFTSRLTTVAVGTNADTVDLVSTGTYGRVSQSVTARLKLKKYMDTTRTPIMVVTPEVHVTYVPRSVAHADTDTTIMDPNSMPALDKTPAYAACMASSATKCDICHLPSGDVSKANVINISKKNAIGTHISHHGDYVTTDNSCDLYKPKTVITVTYHSVIDTVTTVVDKTTYDTTIVIDTAIKVQILSWK